MEDSNLLLRRHHESQMWVRFFMVFLGCWLLLAPETFGYTNSRVFSLSDWISGVFLIFFGLLSMKYTLRHWIWGGFVVGMWLQFAPLIFWAYPSTIYLNDTLIGLFAIALCLVVPFRPHQLELGPEIPPGWSYNPSAWQQRIPVIFLATVGWFAARYLSAYELHYIDYVWDPFFGEGTEKVLTSSLSQSFPVADAGLGAMAYSLEAIMGVKGGTKRWHTMPWIVFAFGILVVPVGFVSILLVMSQPIIVKFWCGLCLIIAACMLIMLALTVDEVLAVCQFLVKSKKEGKPFWKVFWKGSHYTQDELDPRAPTFSDGPGKNLGSMFWGISFPWNRLVSAILGIWLLFANHRLGYSGILADSNDVFCALTITISLISLAEVIRALRLMNILLGIWIALSPFILSSATPFGRWHSLILGILFILLALPRGRIKEKYGSWDKMIF